MVNTIKGGKMSVSAKAERLGFVPIPSFSSGYKLTEDQKLLLWNLLQEDSKISSIALLQRFEAISGGISVALRHLNRIRVDWGLPGKRGRPFGSTKIPSEVSGEVVYVEFNLLYVGIHLFADWMEGEERFSGVIGLFLSCVAIYREEHPNESFALLNHRAFTIEQRFKALFYAPLFSVKKLSELDVKEHPLQTLIGQDYHSSTLNQFLGHLERANIGEQLMHFLAQGGNGQIGYIDGHMIPFWTSRSLHKGKITMLGRIMAGTNAVVAHDEKGNSLFGELYSPDFHMNEFILDYCQQIVSHTGIKLFVIDREINSVDIATAFESKQWGLLSMLDNNQYKGLEDWELTLEGILIDGSPVHSGQWRDEVKRKGDPRWFVIVEFGEKLLPYWATTQFKESFPALKWPDIYTNRTEIQENSFKRMIDHAALNTNYGTKVILGIDRHQQRKIQALQAESDKIETRVNKQVIRVEQQQEKVEESQGKNHGKRLKQRQAHLEEIQQQQKQLEEKQQEVQRKIDELGPPKQRADRDLRKQAFMLFRTLFLENSLRAFGGALLEKLRISISLETLLILFFQRGGTGVETKTDMIYLVNADGLSLKYQQLLQKLVVGINEMRLQHHGKRVTIQVRGSPAKKESQTKASPNQDIKGYEVTKKVSS